MWTTLVLTAAVILALCGLVAGVLALRTLAHLRRSVRILNRWIGRESFVEVQAGHLELAAQAARDVVSLRAEMNAELSRSATRVQAALDELGSAVSELRARPGAEPAAAGPATSIEQMQAAVALAVEQARTALAEDLRAGHSRLDEAQAGALAELAQRRTGLDTDQRSALELVQAALSDVNAVVQASLRRVALVRFDAFDDASGRLSFCLAVLDGRGDGIALTALAGRSDTRLYARPISDGASEVELIPEERQAVRAALSV